MLFIISCVDFPLSEVNFRQFAVPRVFKLNPNKKYEVHLTSNTIRDVFKFENRGTATGNKIGLFEIFAIIRSIPIYSCFSKYSTFRFKMCFFEYRRWKLKIRWSTCEMRQNSATNTKTWKFSKDKQRFLHKNWHNLILFNVILKLRGVATSNK